MDKKDFEKILSVLETIYKKKYDLEIKDVIYKIAIIENLSVKDFEDLILKVVRYNKKYTNELPLPNDIFRFLDEKPDNKNKISLIYDVRNKLRNNLLSMFSKAVVFDTPIIHLIYEKLGGNERFSKLDNSSIENILTYEINNDFIDSFQKTYDIPIFIGIPNADYIKIIGDKEKILNWTNKIKKEIEKIEKKDDLVENNTKNNLILSNLDNFNISNIEYKKKQIERLYKILGVESGK